MFLLTHRSGTWLLDSTLLNGHMVRDIFNAAYKFDGQVPFSAALLALPPTVWQTVGLPIAPCAIDRTFLIPEPQIDRRGISVQFDGFPAVLRLNFDISSFTPKEEGIGKTSGRRSAIYVCFAQQRLIIDTLSPTLIRMISCWLPDSPALNEAEHHHYKCDHEQYMNEPTHGVAAHQS